MSDTADALIVSISFRSTVSNTPFSILSVTLVGDSDASTPVKTFPLSVTTE